MLSTYVLGILALSLPLEAVDYLKDIKPVLKERCISCHGALKQKADLRVDTAAGMIGAKVIVPGSVSKSELLHRITHKDDDERMPPEGHALTDSQVSAIREWILIALETLVLRSSIPYRSVGRKGHW